MYRATTALVAIAALTLTACGGSDSDSESEGDTTPDSVAEATDDSGSSDEAADEPGLTEEEIDDDTIAVLGSYDIDGDELEDGVDGAPTAEAIETFATYTDLIPADYRVGVVTFVAIDQAESGGTDGALQDVIGPDGEPTGERYIALDVSGSSTELERTIVHETGHLIFGEPGGAPTDYFVAFNEEFPPGAEYAPDDFVTEYAASVEDGGEDIAESWAMFVFGDTEFAGDADDDGELDVVPEGTLAADKVAFFEDYPELVQLRDDILS